jgi:hypothetical protein
LGFSQALLGLSWSFLVVLWHCPLVNLGISWPGATNCPRSALSILTLAFAHGSGPGAGARPGALAPRLWMHWPLMPWPLAGTPREALLSQGVPEPTPGSGPQTWLLPLVLALPENDRFGGGTPYPPQINHCFPKKCQGRD